MKKQIKKLSLNKKTISNLNEVEMNKKVGGYYTAVRCHPYHTDNCTGGCTNNKTCIDHNTCNTCI
jgi:natural product precursor